MNVPTYFSLSSFLYFLHAVVKTADLPVQAGYVVLTEAIVFVTAVDNVRNHLENHDNGVCGQFFFP